MSKIVVFFFYRVSLLLLLGTRIKLSFSFRLPFISPYALKTDVKNIYAIKICILYYCTVEDADKMELIILTPHFVMSVSLHACYKWDFSPLPISGYYAPLPEMGGTLTILSVNHSNVMISQD